MKTNWVEMPREKFFEAVTKDSNTLSVGGGICTKCKFCLLGQMGPIAKILYTKDWITIDNFSSCVDLLDKNETITIDISSGMTRWDDKFTWPISKEFFEHPETEKLLTILNEKTNGTAKKAFWTAFNYRSSLKQYFTKDYEFILSLYSIDPGERRKILTGLDQEDETNNVKLFLEENIDLISAVVITWTGNINTFIATIDYVLAHTRPSTIVWFQQIGYTKYSNQSIKDIASKADLNIEEAYDYFKVRVSPRKTYVLSSWVGAEEHRKDFCERIDSAISKINEEKIPLSEVGFIGNEKFLHGVKNPYQDLNWIYFTNNYYGGNITSYDHIPFCDIYTTIENHSKKFSYYVLSKNIFLYKLILRYWEEDRQVWENDEFSDVDFLGERPSSNYKFLFF